MKPARFAALKTAMGGLILPAIAEHRGRRVKTLGDGCIAESGSVVDAVRCAIVIQHGMIGQAENAKFAVADALVHYSDLTIEGFTGTPVWSDGERKHLVETMCAAGFPPCATPDMLARSTKLRRLEECLSNEGVNS